jgi:uncharacterized protein
VRISGATTVRAAPGRVRAALTDPEVLIAAIPGCERFDLAGPDAYQFTLTGRVASIEATYSGRIRIEPEETPTLLTFALSCSGGGSTVAARVHLELTADGPGLTRLSYDADAEIGGALESVGQLVLTAAGRKFAADLLSGIGPQDRLTAQADSSAPAPLRSGAPRSVAPVRLPANGRHSFALGMVAGAALALAAVLAGSRCGQQAR